MYESPNVNLDNPLINLIGDTMEILGTMKPQLLVLRKQTPLHGKMLYIRHSITGSNFSGGRRGRDRMVVGYTTTCAISAYHH